MASGSYCVKKSFLQAPRESITARHMNFKYLLFVFLELNFVQLQKENSLLYDVKGVLGTIADNRL